MDNKLTIAIVDSMEDRRDKMISPFNNDHIILPPYSKYTNEQPGSANLVLMHYGDMEWKYAGELCSKATLIMFYGGNGEPDSRWDNVIRPKGEHNERLWRLVSSDGAKGVLTYDECEELIKYSIALKYKEHPDKPSFLQPQTFNTLISLSVLCQGYLAVHSPEMIFPSFFGKSLPYNAALFEKTNSIRWWVQIFDPKIIDIRDVDLTKDFVTSSIKKIIYLIKNECMWPSNTNLELKNLGNVNRLLDAIANSVKPIENDRNGIDCQIVKRALDSIHAFLFALPG